jgi:trk/ktr system potassium uptake protein
MAGANHAAELSYAVRLPVVFRYLGQLCLVLAALTAVPLLVSVACGDVRFTLRSAVVVALLVALGRGLNRLPPAARIQRNEALVIAALIFVVTPLAMAYPMMASGLHFVDAVFETVSAVTTTGLSATRGVEDKPQFFLFVRAWMQWYGGLGFVVLSLGLVTRPGVVARQLSGRPGDEEDLVGNTKAHARIVIAVYCVLTAAAVALLLAAGVRPFSALLHALAAVSTGGFSAFDESLARLGGWLPQAVVVLICLCGALSLSWYHRALRRGWREALADLQLRGLLAAGLVTAVLLTALLRYGDAMAWGPALHHGPLLALSAQSTAGFASLEVSPLGDPAKLVLIVSMFIGGSVGSTAGGIKVLRLVILLRLLQAMLRRTALPKHAVLLPRLGGRRLEDEEMHDALLLILLFVAVIVVSWLPFLACGYPPLDALFEVVSATATVGLSAGISSVDLGVPLKGILCADMLLGRVEIVALLVTVYPGTWVGKRMERV